MVMSTNIPDPHRGFEFGWSDPTVGIGRPLDPDWLDQASQALSAGLDDGMVFHPRRQSGINFVNPEELLYLAGGSIQTEHETKKQIEALLAGLAITESPPTATSTQLLVVKRQQVELELKLNSYRVKVKVEDIPSDEYPCGYQIEGEQTALRQELGLPTKVRPRDLGKLPKRFWFRLGLLSTGDRPISEEQEALKIMCGPSPLTPFLPVSALYK